MNNPAPATSIVKWSHWKRWTDEDGVTWLRYSLRCTDPLPQELYDKIDFTAEADFKHSFLQVDQFDESEEGVQTFAYKLYGFIIPEEALFSGETLEGKIFPRMS